MNFISIVGVFTFLVSFMSAVVANGSKPSRCSKKLEKIVHCYENNAFTFMKRMYLALLDEGTESALAKRFANNRRVIVKMSNAFGQITSITVPTGMESLVTPEMTGPVKDASGMRAYALGSAFDNNVATGLFAFSGTLL